MILIPIPSNNQSHKFLSGVQDFHLKGYSLASDLYGIFAVKEDKKHKFSQQVFQNSIIYFELEHEFTMV